MTAIYRTYLACGHAYDEGEPTLVEYVRCSLCRRTARVDSSTCVARREDREDREGTAVRGFQLWGRR